MELVKRFGVLALEFEANFHASRNPVGPSPIEYKDRIRGEEETSEEARELNMQYGHLQRLKPLINIIREMRVLSWEAQILFDEDFTCYVDEYWQIIQELRVAIIGYFNPIKLRSPFKDDDNLWKKSQQYHKVVFGYGDEKLTERVKKNTEELTNILKNQILAQKMSKIQLKQTKFQSVILQKRIKELEQEITDLKTQNSFVNKIEKYNFAQNTESEKTSM